MENSASAKIPICFACASGSGNGAVENVPDLQLNESQEENST